MVVAVALAMASCAEPVDIALEDGKEFRTAVLPGVAGPDRITPAFSRDMYAAATLDTFSGPLDACQGPVAIDIPARNAVLVSEHDYCGGAEWISKLSAGQIVWLSGPGVAEGLYKITERQVHPRKITTVGQMPQAPVVLQTCISSSEMVLVAAVPMLDAVRA